MSRILLAGSTGYLGSYIAKELNRRAEPFRTLARSPAKLRQKGIEAAETLTAELTDPRAIEGCCEGIDVVISTVGITRQRDGLTYMDVDYQANLNLLHEAVRSGVRRFIYVSVLNGEALRDLKICEAKERFVEKLEASGLDSCVVRPNGFFSDLTEFYEMAARGRIYLFGDGELRANPIHGADLAVVCVDAMDGSDREIRIGGPDTLTQNEMASMAFDALGKKPRITHIPDWIRVVVLKGARLFTGSRTYGPIEFFLTVMSMDMLAPETGEHSLQEYFASLNEPDV